MTRPQISKSVTLPYPERDITQDEVSMLIRIHKGCLKSDQSDCIFYMSPNSGTKVDMKATPYLKLHFNKSKPVARIMYEIYNGPFNSNRRIRHTCGEPRCVNPLHLYIASPNQVKSKLPREDAYRVLFGGKVDELIKGVPTASPDTSVTVSHDTQYTEDPSQ